jgi:hypothetical protein
MYDFKKRALFSLNLVGHAIRHYRGNKKEVNREEE